MRAAHFCIFLYLCKIIKEHSDRKQRAPLPKSIRVIEGEGKKEAKK